jgi:hypothetical protein
MKTTSPSPKQKTEEVDPAHVALLYLIKKNLKVDILERLSQLVVIYLFRASISMENRPFLG